MTNRLILLIFVAVLGSFVAAVFLGLLTDTPSRAIGALLLACGLTAVAFAHYLTSAQRQLAEKPLIPSRWKNVRPLTFILWGTGVAMIGALQLFGF